MNTNEDNYLNDVIFGIHEYADMPDSFDMPWDTMFYDLHEGAVYVVCRTDEAIGFSRYDGYLVNPQWKRMEAVNQAFVVPEKLLKTKDKTTQKQLFASLDFSVSMIGASALGGKTVGVQEGGCWVGLTPFRGRHIDLPTVGRAFINLVDHIKSTITHGIITVPESNLDGEVSSDDLERTPNGQEFEAFWKERGLAITPGYAIAAIVGHGA